MLGAHYSALGTTRSLGRAGVRVFLVARRSDFPAWSRWGRRLSARVDEAGGPEGLASALESLPLERAVLFPCSDLWAAAVNRLPERTRARFVPCVPPGRAVEILLDKWLLAAEASRLGLPHPKTYRVASAADLSPLDGGGRSFLLKPRSSQPFFRAFGVKAFRATSREDAEHRLAAAVRLGLALVLQERIPGPASSHVLVDGYVDARGAMIACLARRRVRSYPLDLGDSSTVVSIPLEEAAEEVEVTRRLLDGISYRGMFSACFKVDARDGRPVLIEVNCRPWAHLEFAASCGMDVARMAFLEALGHSPPPSRGYRVGARGVLVLPELAALRAQFNAEGMSSPGLVRDSLLALRPTGPVDPLPAIAHVAATVARGMRRAVTSS